MSIMQMLRGSKGKAEYTPLSFEEVVELWAAWKKNRLNPPTSSVKKLMKDFNYLTDQKFEMRCPDCCAAVYEYYKRVINERS